MKSSPFVIALIDDDPFITEGWQMVMCEDILVQAFSSPQLFLKEFNSEYAKGLNAVVTDLHFEGDLQPGGYMIAKSVRTECPDMPLILISNEVNPDLALFDATLPKEPPATQDIRCLVNNIKARKTVIPKKS